MIWCVTGCTYESSKHWELLTQQQSITSQKIYTKSQTNKRTSIKYAVSYITVHRHVLVTSAITIRVSVNSNIWSNIFYWCTSVGSLVTQIFFNAWIWNTKNPRRLSFSAILVSETQSSQECKFYWFTTLTSTYRTGPQLLSWLPI